MYQELLERSKPTLDKFLENITIFENQFEWSTFNDKCYQKMYLENSYDNIATVKELKGEIQDLKDMCKKCGAFYIPQRNKSIPKYDVLLGGVYENLLMDFISDKLQLTVERADLKNRKYPDCKILRTDGTILAYFEVKFHGAPFLTAINKIGRYCYEGSATLDYKKVKDQLTIIEEEIKEPVFYVHWVEYPCLKGIFFETAQQVKDYLEKETIEFKRKKREGDNLKTNKSVYLSKVYSPLLTLESFEDFIETLKNLY